MTMQVEDEDGAIGAVWICEECGTENSEDADPIRCYFCFAAHPYIQEHDQ